MKRKRKNGSLSRLFNSTTAHHRTEIICLPRGLWSWAFARDSVGEIECRWFVGADRCGFLKIFMRILMAESLLFRFAVCTEGFLSN